MERIPAPKKTVGSDGKSGNNVNKTGGDEANHLDETPLIQLEDLFVSFPPGKPISERLPQKCVGNVLEVHDFLCRFHEVLEFQKPVSFEEVEEELVNPCAGRSDLHEHLLKILMSEFQLRVSACINLKHKRGCKDKDMWASGQVLPINELTWPEMVRRCILVSSSIGFTLFDINVTGSAKFLRCLQGDGGILRGSKTGVLEKEMDARLLADALKRIYGSSEGDGGILCMEDTSDLTSSCKDITPNDLHVPEWVKVLEPVRKLPTNVGSRIRNCVYDALKLGPPEWAKDQLEHSISKGVYKGNASGPTKQAVKKVLAKFPAMLLKPDGQKPDRKQKEKNALISEIILRKCRIILRQLINNIDNDTFLQSHLLSFRMIDLRLAARAYGGSPQAFLEDVRELWKNRQTTCAKETNLSELAVELSSNVTALYEQQVLTLHGKLLEYSKLENLTADSRKDMEELLYSMKKIPKTYWEIICEVCSRDENDTHVLLCDGCDACYHTYCLNPPLANVPDGQWYCSSCDNGAHLSFDAPEGSLGIPQDTKVQEGKFVHGYLDSLRNLANIMEKRDYWELSTEERVFVLKFLCNELSNSTLLRDLVGKPLKTSPGLIWKKFLGIDSIGRCYWGFSEPGTHQVVVNDECSTNKGLRASCPYVHHVSDANTWVSYQSDLEIDKVVEYLKVNDPNQKKLIASIKDWQKKRLKHSRLRDIHTEKPDIACMRSKDCEKFEQDAILAREVNSHNDEAGLLSFEAICLKFLSETSNQKSERESGRQILRRLKIYLLDIEAALPEEGMRPSGASSKKRGAWRAFVKSAETIYEMVQATIVLEDTIKTEFLKKTWWYWSSLSAAFRISTLSHLALRIYSLDAAIDYDKVPQSAKRKRNIPGKEPNTKKESEG